MQKISKFRENFGVQSAISSQPETKPSISSTDSIRRGNINFLNIDTNSLVDVLKLIMFQLMSDQPMTQ